MRSSADRLRFSSVNAAAISASSPHLLNSSKSITPPEPASIRRVYRMARSGNTCIVGQLCVRGEARIVLPQSRSVKSQRRGKAVGMCFDRYEKEAVRVAVARLGSELALAAFAAGSDRP